MLGLALAALAACLLYVGSLFTVTLILAALAVCERRHAAVLVGIAVGAAGLTLLLLYGPFVGVLWSEIAPAVWHGARLSGGDASGDSGLGALGRVPLFYGWAYPLLYDSMTDTEVRTTAPSTSTVR